MKKLLIFWLLTQILIISQTYQINKKYTVNAGLRSGIEKPMKHDYLQGDKISILVKGGDSLFAVIGGFAPQRVRIYDTNSEIIDYDDSTLTHYIQVELLGDTSKYYRIFFDIPDLTKITYFSLGDRDNGETYTNIYKIFPLPSFITQSPYTFSFSITCINKLKYLPRIINNESEYIQVVKMPDLERVADLSSYDFREGEEIGTFAQFSYCPKLAEMPLLEQDIENINIDNCAIRKYLSRKYTAVNFQLFLENNLREIDISDFPRQAKLVPYNCNGFGVNFSFQNTPVTKEHIRAVLEEANSINERTEFMTVYFGTLTDTFNYVDDDTYVLGDSLVDKKFNFRFSANPLRRYLAIGTKLGQGTVELNKTFFNITDTIRIYAKANPLYDFLMVRNNEGLFIDSLVNDSIVIIASDLPFGETKLNPRFVKKKVNQINRVVCYSIDVNDYNNVVAAFKRGYESYAGDTWSNTDIEFIPRYTTYQTSITMADSLGSQIVLVPMSGFTIVCRVNPDFYPIGSLGGCSNTFGECFFPPANTLPYPIPIGKGNTSNTGGYAIEFYANETTVSNAIGYIGGQLLRIMDILNVDFWTARYLARESRSYTKENGYGKISIANAIALYDEEFDYDAINPYKYDVGTGSGIYHPIDWQP